MIGRPLVIELGGVWVDEGVAFLRTAGIAVEAAQERSGAFISAYTGGIT